MAEKTDEQKELPPGAYEAKLRMTRNKKGLAEYKAYLKKHNRELRRLHYEAGSEFMEEPEYGNYE